MNRKVRVSHHVLCETISKTRLSLSSRNPNQKWSWTAHSKPSNLQPFHPSRPIWSTSPFPNLNNASNVWRTDSKLSLVNHEKTTPRKTASKRKHDRSTPRWTVSASKNGVSPRGFNPQGEHFSMFWKRAAVSQARPCCSDEHSHTLTLTYNVPCFYIYQAIPGASFTLT